MPKPYVNMSNKYFIYNGETDEGMSGKHNEDNFAIFEGEQQRTDDSAPSIPVYVALVADGIGGNAGGEIASQLTVDTFVQRFQKLPTVNILDRMQSAVVAANNAIRDYTIANPQSEGMGTTIVAAAVLDDYLYVVHAGDSRAYLIRNNQIFQLTLDHTRIQDLLDNGHITVDQIEGRKDRHHITRYLGPTEEVEVDRRLIDIVNRTGDIRLRDQRIPADGHRIRLQAGDIILLTSDGLTDVVSDDQILEIISKRNPKQATAELIRRANKNGGPDNITAVMMQRQAAVAADAVTVIDSKEPAENAGRKLATLPVPMLGWLLAALIAIAAIALGITLYRTPKSTIDVSANATTAATVVEASPINTESVLNETVSISPTVDSPTVAELPPTNEDPTATASPSQPDTPTLTIAKEVAAGVNTTSQPIAPAEISPTTLSSIVAVSPTATLMSTATELPVLPTDASTVMPTETITLEASITITNPIASSTATVIQTPTQSDHSKVVPTSTLNPPTKTPTSLPSPTNTLTPIPLRDLRVGPTPQTETPVSTTNTTSATTNLIDVSSITIGELRDTPEGEKWKFSYAPCTELKDSQPSLAYEVLFIREGDQNKPIDDWQVLQEAEPDCEQEFPKLSGKMVWTVGLFEYATKKRIPLAQEKKKRIDFGDELPLCRCGSNMVGDQCFDWLDPKPPLCRKG